MELTRENTWVGLGVAGGGSMLVVGFEGLEGVMFRADGSKCVHIDKMGVRLGPGLGGGTGVCILAAVHATTYSDMRKIKKMNGWDGNVALGMRANTGSIKAVSALCRMAARKGIKDLHRLMTPQSIDALFAVVKMYYEGAQGSTKMNANKPDIFSISTPAGKGLEVSAHYVIGDCEVTPWADMYLGAPW